jgi:hypothetical protein
LRINAPETSTWSYIWEERSWETGRVEMMKYAMFQKKSWEEQEYECWMNWAAVFAEVRTGRHHRLPCSDAVDLSVRRWR